MFYVFTYIGLTRIKKCDKLSLSQPNGFLIKGYINLRLAALALVDFNFVVCLGGFFGCHKHVLS